MLWVAADFYGETTNMQVEVKALFQGLKLCVENNGRCNDVEVDSKILVQRNMRLGKLAGRLIELLDVQLFHVYRESNRAANWLTKVGYIYKEQKLMFFEGESSLLRSLRGIVICGRKLFS